MRPGNVMVLNAVAKRDSGFRAQLRNIEAARDVAEVVRTSLGPRAMLKMILSAGGSILITNDGNSILREIDITQPASRTIIQLSRAQDEEVGDGTTSVIIIAGEVLSVSQDLLEKKLHPTVICHSYQRALQAALEVCAKIAKPVDVDDKTMMFGLLKTTLGTKFAADWMDLMCQLAYEAVKRVCIKNTNQSSNQFGGGIQTRGAEIDLKRYAKIEKIPGGQEEMSCVLDGIMINKDLTQSAMNKRVDNPRILLLDCPLEYKKGESMTNAQIQKEEDWEELLHQEEEEIKTMCDQIIRLKPTVVVTEKGLSDLASHFLLKAGISAIRRIRKSDNNRIARATGATIVHRPEDIKESDIGKGCGLFEVKKIGDDYFSYFIHCTDPKACTIVLRGASKDVLNEIERNLQDAMCVARNIIIDPRLLPGGGATEMAVATSLARTAASEQGVAQWPRLALAQAFEVIPRTLIENCGVNVIRTVTELRARHNTMWNNIEQQGTKLEEESLWGVDGLTGEVVDVKQSEVWEPFMVKVQTFKSAVDSACMLLRIDDIVSGQKKKTSDGQPAPGAVEDAED